MKTKLTTPLQADRVSGKGFPLKDVASVTLDPIGNIFLCRYTLSRQTIIACCP
ncbi:MAG: hypothetical protein IID17_10310 [Nitrospinae bacterium]|nr:hypothetical protein [Nitrospinota bacterium]